MERAPDALLASPAAQAQGAGLFAEHCALCHGASGDGHGLRQAGMRPEPADLTIPPWPERSQAPVIFKTIRNGVPGTAMPAWPELSDHEAWTIAAYLTAKSLGKTQP